jgi:hypothetical protein
VIEFGSLQISHDQQSAIGVEGGTIPTLFAFPTWTAPILLLWPPLIVSSEVDGAPVCTEDCCPGPPLRFLFSLLVLGGSNWPIGGILAAGRGV